jgi:hypothetical protein
MKRRLYFILPNVASAEQTLRDLLLARIEVGRIHCLARRGMRLGNLPEANFLQKTDVIHGAGSGMALGGFMGVVLGGLLVLFPPAGAVLPLGGTMLITTLFGAAFGVWVASMVGTAVPNSRHAAFQQRIAEGEILMMVDVPFTRTREISDLVHLRHPEALMGGTEPTIPSFP